MQKKLAADNMLGGLAKWLRLLGFDTCYLKDSPIIPIPDRILLTSRSHPTQKPMLEGWEKVIFISEQSKNQLGDAIRGLNINVNDISLLTRCSLCNSELETISAEEVSGRVPEHIFHAHKGFSKCPDCGRIYWPGSHQERIKSMVQKLFD